MCTDNVMHCYRNVMERHLQSIRIRKDTTVLYKFLSTVKKNELVHAWTHACTCAIVNVNIKELQ